MRRKVVIAILILIGMLGVVVLAGDNPDWTLPVSIRAQEIENLSVDIAAQSVDHIDIWFTGQTTDMNVNITNSQIDVNITNSVLNITGDVNATIEGTASVSIDSATITVDVATIRERAPELGKVYSYYDTEHLTAGDSYTRVVFTNSGSTNAYLELITVSATNFFSTLSNPASVLAAHFEIKLKDEDGNIKAKLFANPPTVINLDPALAIPPGWSVEVEFYNGSSETLDLSMSIIIRTE